MSTAVAASKARPRIGPVDWVALIDAGRCACPGCPGALGQPGRFPSWRRCQECGCSWTVSQIGDKRREGVFVSPRCPARRGEEEQA